MQIKWVAIEFVMIRHADHSIAPHIKCISQTNAADLCVNHLCQMCGFFAV